MAESLAPITYEEIKEYSLLERLLGGRGITTPRTIIAVCVIISITLALFHLFVAVYGTPETRSFRSTHLTFMLVLAIFVNPLFRGSTRLAVRCSRSLTTVRAFHRCSPR